MPGPASAVPQGNVANCFILQFAVAAGAAFSAPTAVQRIYSVPGLVVGDIVYAIKPTFQSGLGIAGAQVTTNDNIGITFVCTNGTPTLTAESFFLIVFRDVYDSQAQVPTGIA